MDQVVVLRLTGLGRVARLGGFVGFALLLTAGRVGRRESRAAGEKGTRRGDFAGRI